ncbi:MAG: hypothetical protein M3Q39_09770, partial [Actinomycetota bacterium]|nr:hypothetical protein [Actinomycetota bacterium]
MATQTLYAASSAGGTCTNPASALGAPDGAWAGDLNINSNWTHRWGVTDPTETALAADTQTVVGRFRKGTNSGDPTITSLAVYQDGVLKQTVALGVLVTSTAGQDVTAPWSATSAGITSSQGLSYEWVMTSAGGSGSARNSAQIDSTTWTAQTMVPATEPPPDPPADPPADPAVLFTDTFTGSDGAPWDTAKWQTAEVGTGGVVDVAANEGRIYMPGANSRGRTSSKMPATVDSEALLSYRYDSHTAGGADVSYFRVHLRGDGVWVSTTAPSNGYGVEVRSNTSSVFGYKSVGGVHTVLASTSGVAPISPGTKRWLRLRVQGTTMSVKIWDDGTAEPAAWSTEWTGLTELTAGGVFMPGARMSGTATAPNTWRFDDLTVTDLAPGTPPVPTLTPTRWTGGTTSTGTKITTKTTDATSVRLKISTTADLLTAPIFTAPLVPDANGITKHTVTGLTASTRYYYGVEMDSDTLTV